MIIEIDSYNLFGSIENRFELKHNSYKWALILHISQELYCGVHFLYIQIKFILLQINAVVWFLAVGQVFKELLKPMISPETLKTHPVTELYEVCQKNKLKVKFVDLWKESTAFHIFIEDQLLGRGAYAPKKEIAHNRAAKDALNNIERLLNEKR